MQNRYLKFLIIALAVVIIVPQIVFASWWNPFSWNWNDIILKIFSKPQEQVQQIQQVEQVEQNQEEEMLVGNEKDEHGCIGSAGYTWCEQKQKCLREWEEKCCVPKDVEFGAPSDKNDVCCEGLVKQPTTQSGTVGKCVKQNNQVSDWKIYKNTEYGFEFKYPNDWEIIKQNVSEGAKDDLNMGLWLDGNPQGKEYHFEGSSDCPLTITVYNKQFDQNAQEFSGAIKNEKIINGFKFVEFFRKGTTYPDSHYFVYKLTDNSFIKIVDNTKTTDIKLLSVFDQILSTFKFTK